MKIEVSAEVNVDDEDLTPGRDLKNDDLADAAHDAIKEEVTGQLGIPGGFVTVNVTVD